MHINWFSRACLPSVASRLRSFAGRIPNTLSTTPSAPSRQIPPVIARPHLRGSARDHSSQAQPTCNVGRAFSVARHTRVAPSFSGRPNTPTFTKCRSSANTRCHLIPVCVASTTSARVLKKVFEKMRRRRRFPEKLFALRGLPWHNSSRYLPSEIRTCAGVA